MKITHILSIFAVASLVRATPTKEQIKLSCLVYEDLSFYDLRTSSKSIGDYSIKGEDGTIYTFNICSYAKTGCTPGKEVFAFGKSAGVCSTYSDNSLKTIKTTITEVKGTKTS